MSTVTSQFTLDNKILSYIGNIREFNLYIEQIQNGREVIIHFCDKNNVVVKDIHVDAFCNQNEGFIGDIKLITRGQGE